MKCLFVALLGIALLAFLSTQAAAYDGKGGGGSGGGSGAPVPIEISDCDPDVTAPVLVGVPVDVTLECENDVPSPMANGIPTPLVTATDECDENPSVAFEVNFSDGGPSTIIIERTWTATDASNNSSSATQTVNIFDNTPPEVHCNASNITEIDDEDEEVSFTATSTDACSGVTTQVGWLVCIEPSVDEAELPWWYEYEPCQVTTIYGDDDDDDDDNEGVVVEVDGATITIIKSGEIGTVIGWTAQGTDDCGNTTMVDCSVMVVEEEVVDEDEVADGEEEELPWWGYDPTAPTDDDDAVDDADGADDAEDPWWGDDPTAVNDDDDDDTSAVDDTDNDGINDGGEEELPWWWE